MAHAVLRNDEGLQLDVLGDRYRLLATAEQTDGELAVAEAIIGPGNGAPPHVNNNEAIGWFVVEGSLRFLTESDEFDLEAGGWFYFPKGILHTFRNVTDQPVKVLMIAVPGGMDSFFGEIGRELNGSDPRPPTDQEIALMMRTAPEYGIDVVPPQ